MKRIFITGICGFVGSNLANYFLNLGYRVYGIDNLSRKGTTWPQSDFAKVAEGFGCKSWRVSNVEDYKKALIDASQYDGPKLIDVLVNPEGYSEQLKSLRG